MYSFQGAFYVAVYGYCTPEQYVRNNATDGPCKYAKNTLFNVTVTAYPSKLSPYPTSAPITLNDHHIFQRRELISHLNTTLCARFLHFYCNVTAKGPRNISAESSHLVPFRSVLSVVWLFRLYDALIPSHRIAVAGSSVYGECPEETRAVMLPAAPSYPSIQPGALVAASVPCGEYTYYSLAGANWLFNV